MIKNPSVVVLLATRNGIKWIKDQINSILNQKNVNVDIYISVDLSIDGTYEWCKNLASKNKCIKILSYGNLFGGAAKNFFHLIKEVNFDKYDYISFADHDDIWFPDKLLRAIKLIKDKNLDGYSSDVTAFWSNNKKHYLKKSYPQKKFDYYFESAGPGCTFLLKQQSLQKFKLFLIDNWIQVNDIKLHDWTIYAYFRTFSMLWYIDETPSLLYRQHNHNVMGANIHLKAYINRFQMINNKWYRGEVQKILNLLEPYTNEKITLNRIFLIINFYKLRRRLRDAIFLLCMNILKIF